LEFVVTVVIVVTTGLLFTAILPVVSSRLIVLPQVSPCVAFTGVVLAASRYGPAGLPDDICSVVGMAVPGTRFENPAIPAVLPWAFPLNPDPMSGYPVGKVELSLTFAPRVDTEAARLFGLRAGHVLQLLLADGRQNLWDLENPRRTVRPLREVVSLLGDSAVELRYACCVLGRGVNLDRFDRDPPSLNVCWDVRP
jgi:hypothetical protein